MDKGRNNGEDGGDAWLPISQGFVIKGCCVLFFVSVTLKVNKTNSMMLETPQCYSTCLCWSFSSVLLFKTYWFYCRVMPPKPNSSSLCGHVLQDYEAFRHPTWRDDWNLGNLRWLGQNVMQIHHRSCPWVVEVITDEGLKHWYCNLLRYGVQHTRC